jgi:hypothetical protein
MDSNLEKVMDLSNELEFTELEERLEMVQLAAAEAKRCNGNCDDVPQQDVC